MIVAAGGLLERRGEDGRLHIAVVHRTRYRHRDGAPGDWALPKGKQDPGETLEETALREVEEETGWRARIVGPAFRIDYTVGGAPKQVTFFRMAAEAEVRRAAPHPGEVRALAWWEPHEARERLTYDSERDVVRRAYGATD